VLGALQIAATPAAAAASPALAGAAPTATEGATAATGSARASFPDLWSELLAAVGDGETIGGVKPWRLHGDGDEEGQWVYVLGWTADEVRAHSNAWGLMRYKMWPYFKGLSTLKKMGATTVVDHGTVSAPSELRALLPTALAAWAPRSSAVLPAALAACAPKSSAVLPMASAALAAALPAPYAS
jgi:hypothetical protein